MTPDHEQQIRSVRYDWEPEITQDVVLKMQACLPDGFSLVGVAVEHVDLCEGALIRNHEYAPTGVMACDLFKDVLADAAEAYNFAVTGTFRIGEGSA